MTETFEKDGEVPLAPDDGLVARNFVIVPMTSADLPAVVELEQQAGLSSRGISGYERELDHPQAVLLVARVNFPNDLAKPLLAGALAGRMIVDEFEINDVAVCSGYRRRGIGESLLRAALKRAQELGARRAFLEARAHHAPALALYRKLNFLELGRRRDYYSNPLEDACVLACELPRL